MRGVAPSFPLLLLLCAFGASAEARPLGERWPAHEYWLAGSLTVLGFGGSLALHQLSGDHGARWDWEPALDVSVRANFSESAAQASDVLRDVTIVLPLAAQLSNGFDTAFGNASLLYAEAHAADLLLLQATKEIVRRPRPYTHADSPAIQRFASAQGSDAYLSFYSGHASAAYTSAVAGSLLYAARTREPWARHVMWGTEMLLAGTTAQLRVRAGRHYRTDIWVGSLVGSAIGVAVPAAHGVVPKLRASELGVALGALLLTLVGGELVNPCRLLGCAARDVREPLDAETHEPETHASGLHWSLGPFASEHGPGLQVYGDW